MIGFEELHLSRALAALLEERGWSVTDRFVREPVPSAARGHSLILAAPPAAVYAVPVAAGLLSRSRPGGAPILALCPDPSLTEWGAALGPVAEAAGLSFHMATGMARAIRRLRSGGLDLLLTSPDTALALQRSSALKPESLGAVILAWPELFETVAAIEPVMQDLPKDAQRLLITSDPNASADLAQRYLWKAPLLGEPPVSLEPSEARRVRTVTVPWSGRAGALPLLLDVEDPATAIVWVADRATQATVSAAFPGEPGAIRVAAGDSPPADLIVAYDLPTGARLAQLLQAGSVVVLQPPLAASYLARLAPQHGSLRLPGVLEIAAGAAEARRATIARTIESEADEGALLALAPLFERYDPAAVATALYRLWRQPTATPTALPAPGPGAAAPATGKLWIGVGRKDGVTPDDLVATLTREVRVERGAIGRIEIREVYSLVELPARDVERIGQALNGLVIRKRRVTARPDRGGRSERR